MVESSSQASSQMQREIRRWLADRFCPVGIVFSSPAVREQLLKFSSLGPAELLRPFSEVGNLGNVALQTCEKNAPFRLQNFKLNFVDSHKLDRAHSQSFDNNMLSDFIIQNSMPKKFQDITSSGNSKDTDLQLKRKLLQLLDYHKVGALTPWYTKWKRQFLQQTMFADHELTNQPLIFIYFISTTEQDPISSIDALRRADNLPSLYKEGIYDDSQQSVLQFYFILNTTESNVAYYNTLEIVKQKYAATAIFEISMGLSGKPQEGAPMENLWANLTDLDEQGLMQELHLEAQARGRALNQNDRDKLQATIKRLTEKSVLPFIEKRIRNLEISIANTRKGIKNQFKNLWKKAERGENDGLRENFKMNKEELELRNLVDLALVAQDYETAMNNGKIPLSDFKKCKAIRHAASCQEIIAFAALGLDSSGFTSGQNAKELDSQLENAYGMYQRSGKLQYVLRCGIYISEIYDTLERSQECANILLRLASEIRDNSVLVPLFQEQAAYKYLQLRNFRKFCLYMIMAGKSYEKLNLQHYSFNCFTIVHPFYQRFGRGWNGIRFQLYSSLGRNSQIMGDITLAVQFFRNLLQLCCEFDHQNEQKNCLNEFLIAVQNWTNQKSVNLIGVEGEGEQHQEVKKAHIGQLNLPIIMEDSIEVFLSSEKLFTNKPETLINQYYFAHPVALAAGANADDNQEYVIQQKAELNTINCPWKFMAKHLFEHMNDEKRKQAGLVDPEACMFNAEELNEFTIYDCPSRIRKRELILNKCRKAYVGESIVVKLMMRNPLMADIFINSIKLICRYEDAQAGSDDFDQLERNIVLRSLETKEIILEISPRKTGKFIIERIEWVLFDVVSCAYQMVKPTDKDKQVLTQEELAVPKKLLDRESNFIYDVLERSGEISAKVSVPGNTQIPAGGTEPEASNTFIFTEMQRAELQVNNESYKYALKNGYAVCSHPMIFGFSRLRLFDRIEKGGKFTLPLAMRASQLQNNEIKFLIRYEVEYPSIEGMPEPSKMAKYRFCRVVFNLDSLYGFTPKRHVHLSTKKANEHIFNIQIVDNLAPGSSLYHTPQIEAIEIVNTQKLWTLKKKDERGQFFIIIPSSSQENLMPVQSLISYQQSEVAINSIFEDRDKKNYFEQEQAFVMSKFKMQPTVEEEEVDIVIQWAMPKLGKRGFYCLFKIPLLKIQKQLTEQQKRLQRQKTDREPTKINPLHLAYQYEKHVTHDFSGSRPATVEFSLSISNMIQSADHAINCRVEGLNEWANLVDPSDVSESNSYLWVGKTQHVIKNLKANEIKQITLRAAIVKPGVYNLNRFRVVIEEGEHKNHFMNEIRLEDDILIAVKDASRSAAPANLISL